MHIMKNELRLGRKKLLIWSLGAGLFALLCLLLFDGVRESMEDAAAVFADMGAFSQVLGMDRVSIGTLEGYYAIEVTLIISLGGAMYAALTGANMLAGESEGHTAEFLCSLPVRRSRIVIEKSAALVVLCVIFNAICTALMVGGFYAMGVTPDAAFFAKYHLSALLMNIELGSVCMLISACVSRKPQGVAFGVALLAYFVDVFARIAPSMEKVGKFAPFRICSAADIYAGDYAGAAAYITAAAVSLAALAAAAVIYSRRDVRA